MRARPGTCLNCGYDLSGTKAGRHCPECNAPPTDAREALDGRAMTARSQRALTALLVAGVFGLLAWICSGTPWM